MRTVLRGSRASRHPFARGSRRGAMMVIGAVLLTALIVMVAFSADLGRLMTVKNELQTAADAAALAGSSQLFVDPSLAQSVAQRVADANTAEGGAVVVDQVEYGVWSAGTRSFTPVASPQSADAMRLTIGQPATYMFGGRFLKDKLRVLARATAWGAAPGGEQSYCAKPWMMSYADIMGELGKAPDDSLTSTDLRKMRDTAHNRLDFQLQEGGFGPGNYGAVDLPAGTSARGAPAYEAAIAGCNYVKVGDVLTTEPGKMVGPTRKGMESFCHPLDNNVCYNEQGGIGVAATVPVLKDQGAGGRSTVTVDFIATVIILGIDSDGTIKARLFALNTSGKIESPGSGRNSTNFRTVLVD